MHVETGAYSILAQFGIALIVSLLFGLALFKSYQLFQQGKRENSSIKIWWSFSSMIFILAAVILLFGGKL
jgi:hypothetical protein